MYELTCVQCVYMCNICICKCVCVPNINAFFINLAAALQSFGLPFLTQAQVAAGSHNCAQADQHEQHKRQILQAAHKARDRGVAGARRLAKLC